MGMPGDTRPRNGFGIAALVLGLLAVALFWTVLGGILLGILALVFGLLGRSSVKRGQATNSGMSIAGLVLGVVGLLLSIVVVLVVTSTLQTPAGQDFRQCVEQAGDDRQALQQCARDFSREMGAE